VLIDSELLNSNHQHLLMEHESQYAGTGGHPMAVFQNDFIGYRDAFGIATDWPQDCIDSGGEGGCGSTGRWQVGSNNSTHYFRGSWIINSRTTTPIDPNKTSVIVVVNGGMGGGCDNDEDPMQECGGTIGYTDHWPNPLGRWIDASPPTLTTDACPNGRIAADVHGVGTVTVPVYCFTSIDAALAAPYHATTCPDCPLERPKYLTLSNSGWLDGDADGVPNYKDNCTGVTTSTQLCDTDQDGYGNRCDADYSTTASPYGNDGVVGGPDYSVWLAGFNGMSAGETDHNCDGTTGGPDYGTWTSQFGAMAPGPSGLSCAGSSPCP
jgi:hypothetical protein